MRPVFFMSRLPPWYDKERADRLRYIIECTPPDQPVNLTELAGCVEMGDNTDESKQMLTAFMGVSEQISDLKATMVAKFDATEKQLDRLGQRTDSMAREMSDIRSKVFDVHDKALEDLENDCEQYVSRREFNGGLNRIRSTVDSFKWALGLVLLFVSALSIPMFLRFMGWA